MAKSNILLVGRANDALDALLAQLSDIDADFAKRVVSNGHADPLHGVDELPTLLVLLVSEHAEAELQALASRPLSARPATLVIAETSSSNVAISSSNASRLLPAKGALHQ